MSSASFRVRIALNLKEYLKINPIGYVPALVDGGILLADSFAIILYLEEKYPQHPLLPRDLVKKAINYQVISFGFLHTLKSVSLHSCLPLLVLWQGRVSLG
ncbi:putative glutathione transferase [Helianthus annuus]|nr:putative glutathione transferase [Helianthus annuus]